jgi:hypothetical protein
VSTIPFVDTNKCVHENYHHALVTFCKYGGNQTLTLLAHSFPELLGMSQGDDERFFLCSLFPNVACLEKKWEEFIIRNSL